MSIVMVSYFFFCNDAATTEIYTYLHSLSLHDALPISSPGGRPARSAWYGAGSFLWPMTLPPSSLMRTFLVMLPCHRCKRCLSRSEEHKSELQSLMRISYAVFCLKKINELKDGSQ